MNEIFIFFVTGEAINLDTNKEVDERNIHFLSLAMPLIWTQTKKWMNEKYSFFVTGDAINLDANKEVDERNIHFVTDEAINLDANKEMNKL